MPDIATVGDLIAAHDGYPQAPIITGQARYTIQNREIATIGSAVQEHSKINAPTHSATIVQGSTRYTIRGIPISFIGCASSCGSVIETGRPGYTVDF